MNIGDKAPERLGMNENGEEILLGNYRGKKVVLYFYPKDNTPGCTRQACAFAAAYSGFREKNSVVIGISRDSTASHQKFAEKYDLPFILLSDPDRIAIDAYGVWQEKKRCGKVSMGIVRSTFLIDEEGRIAAAMEGVKPDTNPAEVLALL